MASTRRLQPDEEFLDSLNADLKTFRRAPFRNVTLPSFRSLKKIFMKKAGTRRPQKNRMEVAGTLRLNKEFFELQNADMKTFGNVTLPYFGSLYQWTGLLVPENPPYNKGAFKVQIDFPADYPFIPPKVTFQTKMYHPNIDENGQVCLPIIAPENWTSATRMEQVVGALIALVNEPDSEHPLRADLAEEYARDRKKFMKNAEEHTKNAERRPLLPAPLENSNFAAAKFESRFDSEFDESAIVGKGRYGIVFKAVYRFDGCSYATKRIAVVESAIEKVKREVQALAKLQHQHIVRYCCSWPENPPPGWQEEKDAELLREWQQQGVHFDSSRRGPLSVSTVQGDKASPAGSSELSGDVTERSSAAVPKKAYVYIQMELCNGDLYKWLDANRHHRDLAAMLVWFKQIVSAVDYIHTAGFAHRDLAPRNILFARNGDIKVGDFGLAKEDNSTQEQGVDDQKKDMHDLGEMLFDMLCPSWTDTDHAKLLLSKQLPDELEDKRQKECALIRRLLDNNPQNRPSCAEILKSEIFIEQCR